MQPTAKEANDITVPPGSIVLHIGPHKTGTTALQIAMGKNREAMLEQGVRYVWGGEHLNANLAALAVARRPSRRFSGARPVPIQHWTELIEKIRASSPSQRTVISGEEFCSAKEIDITRIIRELGKDRLRVLITLRPLEKVIASQWQQYVQAGSVTMSLDEWLRGVFDNNHNVEKVQDFWERHRHDLLVHRWAQQIGNDRITILVLDENDREYLYRKAEALFGLRQGTLIAHERLINRSMTMQEAESVRAFYSRLNEEGFSELSNHIRFMISPAEVIKRERVPSRRESKIILPEWALQASRALSEMMVQSIQQEQVRIVGKISGLTPSEAAPSIALDSAKEMDYRQYVPVDLAGWTAFGVVVRSGLAKGSLPPVGDSSLPPSWLRRASGADLLREVFRRLKNRVLKLFRTDSDSV